MQQQQQHNNNNMLIWLTGHTVAVTITRVIKYSWNCRTIRFVIGDHLLFRYAKPLSNSRK